MPEHEPGATFVGRLSRSARERLERLSSTPPAPSSPAPSSSAPSSPAPISAATSTHGRARAPRARDVTHDRYLRALAREGRRLKALQARFKLTGVPRGIPIEVVRMARVIRADGTGIAAKSYVRKIGNRVYAGAVLTAALVPMGDGRYRYTWADERARIIVALGCFLHAMSVHTRRRGRWSRVVRGFTQGALAAVLANPYEPDRRPSLSAINGRHRPGASLHDGQLGYLRALEAAGAIYSQQLPTRHVTAFERVWPSGYASNRYWLVTDRADAPDSAGRRDQLHGLRRVADALLAAAARPLRAVRAIMRRGLAPTATAPPAQPP